MAHVKTSYTDKYEMKPLTNWRKEKRKAFGKNKLQSGFNTQFTNTGVDYRRTIVAWQRNHLTSNLYSGILPLPMRIKPAHFLGFSTTHISTYV